MLPTWCEPLLTKNISSRFTSNSEADASELLENMEDSSVLVIIHLHNSMKPATKVLRLTDDLFENL